jgi:hypothetical protein
MFVVNTPISGKKVSRSALPKTEKKVACKEGDGETVRQDKIIRTIFVLQKCYIIAANQAVFHAREVKYFFHNLHRLHARDHVWYLPQKVPSV